MRTTLIEYTVKYCLLLTACLFCFNSLQAEEDSMSSLPAKICANESEQIMLCLNNVQLDEAAQAFIVTITCDGLSNVYLIPASNATAIDADNDGAVDDLQIDVTTEIGNGASILAEELPNGAVTDPDCLVTIDIVTNTLAVTNDEIPPVKIKNSDGTVTVNIGSLLQTLSFCIVKPTSQTNSVRIGTCSYPNSLGALNLANCTQSPPNNTTKVKEVDLNDAWSTINGSWVISNVQLSVKDGTGSCIRSTRMSGLQSSNSSITFPYSSLGNSSSSGLTYHLDFTLNNSNTNLSFTPKGSSCSSYGRFIPLPMSIPINEQSRGRN